MRSPRRTEGTRAARAVWVLAVAAALAWVPGTDPTALASATPAAPRPAERRPASSPAADLPAPEWREGPVRYLLTQEEDQSYRRLKTDAERSEFIARFWKARDPDPSTPENEYRALFLERVEAATRLFRTESTKPGWKTDRGKIYILLGPPDELTQPALGLRTPEIITWTYRVPPPGTGASPNSQISFVRDPSGEYRLSSGVRTFLSESALSRALALQALQMKSLPGTHEVPGGSAASTPGGESSPMRLLAGFFRSGSGRTLVVLTVWADERLFTADPAETPDGGSRAPVPFDSAVARLLAAGGTDAGQAEAVGSTVLRAGEGALAHAPDQSRVFQGGCVVRPGEYVVEAVLLGSDSTTLHSLTRKLSVPDLDGGALAVGSITLAAHLERLEANPWPEYTAPFVLGRLRVVPRADNVFRQGEELAFYYQVLGSSTDPIEGLPDLDLEYTFLVDGGPADSSIPLRPFGHPIHLTHDQNQVQGFSLPLADWPPGAYRLEVVVTDNLTGGSARAQIPFRVR